MPGDKAEPRISVIIPTYNVAHQVVRAVKSALEQTYTNIEIIVVDDGSTDETSQLLQPYQQKIRYIYQENQGRSRARNKGISSATGEFIACLDADDEWYPEKLTRQMEGLLASDAGWSYCDCRLVTETGALFESDFWPERFGAGHAGSHHIFDQLLMGKVTIHTSTIVVRRELLQQVGEFDETLKVGEDTDLWFRLAYASPVLYVPELLATRTIDTRVTFYKRLVTYEYAYHSPLVIKNVLKNKRLEPQQIALASQSLVHQYIHSTFIELSAGKNNMAENYWHEVKRLVGGNDFQEKVAISLAQFALGSARYHVDGPLYAESILADLLPQLPQVDIILSLHSVYGELFASVAHMYTYKGDRQKSAYYALRTLRTDFTKFKNIGLWKIAFSRILQRH